MSELTKKRVRWFEKNKETDEILHDEDVDILTSAEATLFDDGESLQEKYDNGNIARTSQLGDLNALATTNDSNLVDALNEVNTSVSSNTKSIETLSANMTSDIESAVNTAKAYTDTKVADLVGTAPQTLDTLEEVAQAIEENEDVVTALNSAIGSKANQSDLNTLTTKVNTNTSNISTNTSNISNLTTRVTNVETSLGFELTLTLTSGETSLTFTDSRITTSSTLVSVYTSIFGVAVKSAVFANGSLTLTFPAQTVAMTVKAVIK